MNLDHTGRALVAADTYWIPITPDHAPPLGAKVIVINRDSGVAAIDNYHPRYGWTHYVPMPKFESKP